MIFFRKKYFILFLILGIVFTIVIYLVITACLSFQTSIRAEIVKSEPKHLKSTPTYSDIHQPEILSQKQGGDKAYRSHPRRDLFYKIISVFEYDSGEPMYCEIFNLDDGRGYTAGLVGFTSEYEDFYLLLQEYTRIKPENSLSKYLQIIKSNDYSISELRNLPKDWKSECLDPRFKTAQDTIADKLYYYPALDLANNSGIKSEIGQLILFDSIIQHGNFSDPDGLPAMVEQTNQIMSGSPKDGIDEFLWLEKFLAIRRNVLINPTNDDTKEVWRQSVDRCDYYIGLVRMRESDLIPPILIRTVNHNITITE